MFLDLYTGKLPWAEHVRSGCLLDWGWVVFFVVCRKCCVPLAVDGGVYNDRLLAYVVGMIAITYIYFRAGGVV